MKILAHLTAREDSAVPWRDTRGNIAGLHHEIAPGEFLHVTLSAAGLKLFHGEHTVGIPIEELVRLAVESEPALAPGSKARAEIVESERVRSEARFAAKQARDQKLQDSIAAPHAGSAGGPPAGPSGSPGMNPPNPQN